MEQEEGPVVMH